MALPPIGTLKFNIVFKTRNGTRRCSLFYDGFIPSTVDDLGAAAEAVSEHLVPLFVSVMPDTHLILRVEGFLYGSGGVTLEANSTTGGTAGEIPAVEDDAEIPGSNGLPDECCLIIRRRTGVAGRSKRGRIFVPGLSELVQANGYIIEDYIPECKAIADAMSDAITFTGGGAEPYEMFARHWDRKNSLLVPIVKCYALATVGTRIDRRRPLTLDPL